MNDQKLHTMSLNELIRLAQKRCIKLKMEWTREDLIRVIGNDLIVEELEAR